MIGVSCIKKWYKKNGTIYGYQLQDCNGKIINVEAEQLKQAIRDKSIYVNNLTLTSDNRLIDASGRSTGTNKTVCEVDKENIKNTEQQSNKTKEDKIKDIILKAKVLGTKINKLPTSCGHECYVIPKTLGEVVLYIPDDVTEISSLNQPEFTDVLRHFNGHLKVVGGHFLKSTEYMFKACEFESIDLTELDTSHLCSVRFMFCQCKVHKQIKFGNFNTSKVTSMEYMFYGLNARSLNLYLNSFDTSRVQDMKYMFLECTIRSLDLSKFDTSNVKSMNGMFQSLHTMDLNVSSFNTHNVDSMRDMFKNSNIETERLYLCPMTLVLNFDTTNVKDMTGMFHNSLTESIDISSFKINRDSYVCMDDIFMYCHSKMIIKDSILKDEYESELTRC